MYKMNKVSERFGNFEFEYRVISEQLRKVPGDIAINLIVDMLTETVLDYDSIDVGLDAIGHVSYSARALLEKLWLKLKNGE